MVIVLRPSRAAAPLLPTLLQALIPALLWAAATTAQPAAPPAEAPALDDNDCVALIPAFKELPAPDWVKPGVQVANAIFSAVSRAGGGYELSRDGDFVDQFGRRYDAAEGFASGGQGFAVTTISGADRRAVAMQTNIALGSATGPLAPSMVLAGVTYAGANNLWIHPAGLKALLAAEGPGRLTFRAPVVIGEQKYNAVVLLSRAPGSQHYWVWDEETGLLLRSSSIVLTRGGPGTVGVGKTTHLTRTSFAGRRALKLPWNDARPPAWAADFRALRYDGATTIAVTGTNPVTFPLRMSLEPGRRGPAWTETVLRLAVERAPVALPPTEVRTLNSPYALMGAYVPPDGLAALRPNQQLDQDPATGFTYTVAGAARGPGGARLLVIREAGKVHTVDAGYDLATGMLVTYRKFEQTNAMTTTTTQAQLAARP